MARDDMHQWRRSCEGSGGSWSPSGSGCPNVHGTPPPTFYCRVACNPKYQFCWQRLRTHD